MRLRAAIPNLFTLGNLCCGVAGIILLTVHGHLELACLAVFAGAFLDLFDGLLARLLKVESDVGAQLDSLADVVTFGVLPGLIAYYFIPITIEGESVSWYAEWMRYLAFLIPVAAAWRLAVFNTDEGQSSEFKGLPSPASGLLWASIPLAMVVSSAWQFFAIRLESLATGMNLHVLGYQAVDGQSYKSLAEVASQVNESSKVMMVELDPWMHVFSSNAFYLALTLLTAGLMISRIPMFSLKFKKGGDRRLILLFLGFSLGLFLSLVLSRKNPFAPIPIIILLYVLTSIGSYFITRRNAVQSRN